MADTGRALGVNVWHEDVYYPAGSTPPAEVAGQMGEHVWASDFPAPQEPESGVQAVPALLPPLEEHVTLTEPPNREMSAPLPRQHTPVQAGSVGGSPAGGAGGSAETPGSGGEVGPPPLSGPGSSAEAWRAYAAAHGVDVGEHAKRPEVLDALRTAGIPVGD